MNCTVYLKKTLILQVRKCFIVDANKDNKSTLVSVWACCWYKQPHKRTLDSICLAAGTTLKIHDFSATPIYGSMCYKALPKDGSNEKWVNSIVIDEFQNKSILL